VWRFAWAAARRGESRIEKGIPRESGGAGGHALRFDLSCRGGGAAQGGQDLLRAPRIARRAVTLPLDPSRRARSRPPPPWG
jgi:hypothetical protein